MIKEEKLVEYRKMLQPYSSLALMTILHERLCAEYEDEISSAEEIPMTTMVANQAVPTVPPVPKKKMFPGVCTVCGVKCLVPFEPRDGMPLYCMGCYAKRQNGEL